MSVVMTMNHSCHYHYHYRPRHCPAGTSIISCSLRRHHRRRRGLQKPNQPNPLSPSDEKLRIVIDVETVAREASTSLKGMLKRSSVLTYDDLFRSGAEALEDLQTLIAVDSDRRVVLSCRMSTLQFLGNLVLWSCFVVFAFRVLVKLGLGLWGARLGFDNKSGVIWRRDRSLGGREVVVGKKRDDAKLSNLRVLKNPLSPAQGSVMRAWPEFPKNWTGRTEKENKLPGWWPVLLPPPVAVVDKEEYQRMANRLIRAILDHRISGRDISEDSIIQFRRLCRTSGARVIIDTTNARDSLYRASVEFVLNICGSAENQPTSVHIDGEDPQAFIAGLADNIGLEDGRAARIVSATVAARTRSSFLQAWALEMQGKHSEAELELLKICLIHQIFPPEENS
ncbi:uncharacterized protein LOC127789097 isoform X2 [Diospyros lotus]|nr:uncharacterized protein LOC127789097 isoform X2 [Diospyros lotus]